MPRSARRPPEYCRTSAGTATKPFSVNGSGAKIVLRPAGGAGRHLEPVSAGLSGLVEPFGRMRVPACSPHGRCARTLVAYGDVGAERRLLLCSCARDGWAFFAFHSRRGSLNSPWTLGDAPPVYALFRQAEAGVQLGHEGLDGRL
jgi:hypothetical protein